MTTISNVATNPALGQTLGAGSQIDGGLTGGGQGNYLSIERFEGAISRASQNSAITPNAAAQNGIQVAQLPPQRSVDATKATSSNPAPTQVSETSGADRNRALKGLDLDQKAVEGATGTTGDTIIDGIGKLREVFDNQEKAITDIGASPLGNSEKLIGLQLEVVKYSMLMDITSKLTGKSTQAFDTLLKGQ